MLLEYCPGTAMTTGLNGSSSRVTAGIVAMLCATSAAQAALEISSKATSNVTCSSGVCTATAKKAVLNVSDLANMLASGDVTVASGGTAQDIEIDAALSWTSSHRLTLDSFHSIAVSKPIAVAGPGPLTITTNDGGSGGDYQFGKRTCGVLVNSALVIDGDHYGLFKSMGKLVKAINRFPEDYFALAKSIDLSKSGT
jgi:hypothetical protein